MKCETCDNIGWVCENRSPRDDPRACSCGGAGAPCPTCNVPVVGEAPRMPDGYWVEVDKNGWRH